MGTVQGESGQIAENVLITQETYEKPSVKATTTQKVENQQQPQSTVKKPENVPVDVAQIGVQVKSTLKSKCRSGWI